MIPDFAVPAASRSAERPLALPSSSATIVYRLATVDGIGVFYREAGPKDAPVIVLLHGFPSSSRMFEEPDPASGDALPRDCARLSRLRPERSARAGAIFLYVRPSGGNDQRPARSARRRSLQPLSAGLWRPGRLPHPHRSSRADPGARDPERQRLSRGPRGEVERHRRILGGPRRRIPRSRKPSLRSRRQGFATRAAARVRSATIPPSGRTNTRSSAGQGQQAIQEALLYDYRTNVAAYPVWRQWLREHKPPTLIAWGGYDASFIAAGGEAYRRDLPDAEVHILEAGHFALDEKVDEIAALTLDFLSRRVG